MEKGMALAMALLVLTPVLAFSTPAPAFAAITANVWGNDVNGAQFQNTTGLGNADPRTTIAKIIQLVISFLGIIAVVIILLGGFKWMTAGGNEDKVGEAKKLITAGLIGLVIILASYAIAVFVLNSLASVTSNT